MPPPETFHRHDRMLLWRKVGNNRYGNPIVSSPEELMVRWEDGQKDVRKPDGTFITVDATVVVNIDIEMGSTVWLAPNKTYSALEQFMGSGSGVEDTDIMEVVTRDITPDLKGRVKRRVLGVARFKQDRPELES